MSTIAMILGWTLEQWRAAGAELGLHVSSRDFYCSAVDDDSLAYLSRIQAEWEERHYYAPLQSPIVIPDSYRTRAHA